MNGVQKLNALYQQHGVFCQPENAPIVSQSNKPACDFCGKDGSGTKKCTACTSVYYCSKECQRGDWKKGHKALCAQFKANCQQTSEVILRQLRNTSLSSLRRVQELDRLDGEGVYRAAVIGGLYPTLTALLIEDAEGFPMCEGGTLVCAVNWVTTTIFRGHRRARAGMSTFGKCDASRVAEFIRSDAGAWPAWILSAAAAARRPLDRSGLLRDTTLHLHAHRDAKDSWCFLNCVFAKEKAARAVFLVEARLGGGGGGDNDCQEGENEQLNVEKKEASVERSVERAKVLGALMQSLLKDLNSASEDEDPNSSIEANVVQSAAMLSYWCRHFELQFDFEKSLGLKGEKLAMYKRIAVPLGEATIGKGSTLTNAESRAALDAAARMKKGSSSPQQKRRAHKKR